ncbi:MAG: aspartyl protease [Thermoprotei archaeon]|nr:MAG: aspartyl protease [Thermoprotei archaeon]
MGLVYVRGVVKWGGREREVRFLVDSGATYTVLERGVWEHLGLEPKREVRLVLADGTEITRALSEAVIELPGYGEYHSPVILGEEGDVSVLGSVTLEIFGLMLDPLKRELRPLRALLVGSRRATFYPR